MYGKEAMAGTNSPILRIIILSGYSEEDYFAPEVVLYAPEECVIRFNSVIAFRIGMRHCLVKKRPGEGRNQKKKKKRIPQKMTPENRKAGRYFPAWLQPPQGWHRFQGSEKIRFVVGKSVRPWSLWTANSDKKLNVNKPYMSSRKTAFAFLKLSSFVFARWVPTETPGLRPAGPLPHTSHLNIFDYKLKNILRKILL